MQVRITPEEMEAAARQLARTPDGRAGLRRLLEVIERNDFKLGLLDQHAFLTLLGGAWSGQREHARQVMGAALDEAPSDAKF